jgi:hypothetical protein
MSKKYWVVIEVYRDDDPEIHELYMWGYGETSGEAVHNALTNIDYNEVIYNIFVGRPYIV